MTTLSISTQRPAARASSVKTYLAALCAMLATLLCAMSFVATAPAAAKGHYEIRTHTCGGWFTGTNANVHIKLYGTAGTSPWLLLDEPGRNDFKAWAVDDFSFYLTELGTLKSVVVKRDDSGISPNWCLNVVGVTATINNVKSSKGFYPYPISTYTGSFWIPSGSLGTTLHANE